MIEQVVLKKTDVYDWVENFQYYVNQIHDEELHEAIVANVRRLLAYVMFLEEQLEKEDDKMTERKDDVEYWVKLSSSGNGIILQDNQGKLLAFGRKETLEKVLAGEKKAVPLKKSSPATGQEKQ